MNLFSRTLLLIIVLLAIRISLILVIGQPDDAKSWLDAITFVDSTLYIELADDLGDGSWDYPSFRTPGYPLFLLVTEKLLSSRWLATLIIHQLLDAFTALLCFLMARRVARGLFAAAAAAFYMILPSQVIWSTRVLPDTWVALFASISGFMWLSAVYSRSERHQVLLAALCGLALSIGVWFKAVFVLSFLVYGISVFLVRGLPTRSRIMIALSVILFALVGPGSLRHINNVRFNLNALSTQQAFEPMGRAVVRTGYMGITNDGSIWAFRDSIEAAFTDEGVVDYARRDSTFHKIMLDAIKKDPLRLIYIELTRWPKFFLNFDAHDSYLGLTPEDRKPFLFAFVTSIIQSVLFLAFVYIAITERVWKRNSPELILATGWFVYSALLYGPAAGFRYGGIFYWALIPMLAMFLERFFRKAAI